MQGVSQFINNKTHVGTCHAFTENNWIYNSLNKIMFYTAELKTQRVHIHH